MSKLKREDLLEAGTQKSYTEPARIAGVEVFPLTRHVDDRGSFLELYRASAAGDHGSGLAAFFAGITVGQLNYSLVTTSDHVKGLHVHLAQDDVWFCPPPFKMRWSSSISAKTHLPAEPHRWSSWARVVTPG